MRTADGARARLKAAMNRIDINGTATWLCGLEVDCFFLSPIVELADKCHFIIATRIRYRVFTEIVDTEPIEVRIESASPQLKLDFCVCR